MSIDEKEYERVFQIIVHAGESRSLASEAMDAAERYEYDKAENLIEKANDEFLKCHELQTNLLTNEVNGVENDTNVILIHALDHLTMATLAIDHAKRWIRLCKKIEKMEE